MKKGALPNLWEDESKRPEELGDIDYILAFVRDAPESLEDAPVVLNDGDVIRFGPKKMDFTYRE
ncbi:MAG: hypothetical protein KKC75_07185 [Nanoarchaeota archaeon]|nr:hypothetical protein [Nanoarchaeota archaeon]MBU1005472.1 hypothetical protein [Nanoarchaeota archaeon]MBU1947042.1 hypothetical protein [Nanoarchaeota archaeon]